MHSSRRRKSVVVAVGTALVTLMVPAGVAGASGTGPAASTPTPAALQSEAAALTQQIQVQGLRLDQLSEAVDAARLRAAGDRARLATTRRQLGRTDAALTATEAELRRQAVAAYLNAGAPTRAGMTVDTTGKVMIAEGYAEVLSGDEHRAMDQLAVLRRAQGHQMVTLAAAERSDQAALAELVASQAQAADAQAAQMATLDALHGRLASLVAADQAAQAQSQARSEQAVLASTGQLPRSSTAVLVASPARGSAAPGGPGTGATAPAPPATPNPYHPTVPTTAPGRAPAHPPPATTYPATTYPVTPPPPVTTPPTTQPAGNTPAPGWQTAVSVAEAQIGKPYQWGGAGPDSFDCSGLVMYAWAAAGVYFPHLAQDQYDMTARIPLSDLLPGDLVFFGTPADVYHVGIYIGGGEMVDAPETGQDVQIQSIYWPTLLGGGRVSG